MEKGQRIYQICTKGIPENMNPFASLIITYLVGATVAFIMFLILGDSRNILTELKKANWTSFVLGIILVGLESGFIYAYKAGWKVSAAQIVTSSILGGNSHHCWIYWIQRSHNME